MYMIEMVLGIRFKKDVEHASYQVKQWQHQKKQQMVEHYIIKKVGLSSKGSQAGHPCLLVYTS
jgi:hypothetical protein